MTETTHDHARVAEPEIRRLSREEIAQLVTQDMGLPTSVTDEMAIPTHMHGNPLIRWLFWRRYEGIARLAGFHPKMTVLEFGCGIGVFLPTLCANAGRVLAIDLFPQYAQQLAMKRGLRVTFPADLESVEDGSLDLIIAADVLEHIHELDALLAAFRRKLKPGGRLLMSGPTENIVYKAGRILAGFGDKGEYHVSNVSTLRRDIVAAGFVQRRTIRLPFAVPPHLFRVHEFAT